MKVQRSLILLFVAMLAIACIPAIAGGSYKIEAENLVTASEWTKVTAGTQFLGNKVPAAGAKGGYALSIVDSIKVSPPDNKPKDMHGTGGATNVEDLLYRNIADPSVFQFGFSNNCTAIFRMKTTDEQAFSTEAWERSIILAFTDGTYRKCIGFAVRPSGAVICNSGGGVTYGGVIPSDNTQWHTWAVVGKNMTSTGGQADVYLDGKRMLSNVAVNLTTDTVLTNAGAYINGLAVGSCVSGTVNDGTGSWLIDWVAYKQGVHPRWDPDVAGSISGVVHEAGNPSATLANVPVTLTSEVMSTTVTSGPDGSFTFGDLDLDTYTVSATAPGHFGGSTAPVTLSPTAASPTVNVGLVAVPASGAAVYDTFTNNQGDLTRTEDSQQLPWLAQSDQTAYGVDYASWGSLTMNACTADTLPHGFSIGGGFAPANVDMTFDVSMDNSPNWGFGAMYRQGQPCVYDTYPLVPAGATEYGVVQCVDGSTALWPKQTEALAGYLVFFSSTGTSQTVNLWRNGLLLQAGTLLDWASTRKVRILAYGDYHEVQVDGQKVLSAVHAGKLTGGYVGVTRYDSIVRLYGVNVQPLAEGSSLGTISGSVYDSASPSTKLAGAIVTLSDGRTATTDANGSYSIALSSLNTVTVTGKRDGYLDKSVVLSPALGANTVNLPLDTDSAFRDTIAGAKAAGVGSAVALGGKILTSSWSGSSIYLEEPNRSAAIKVTLPVVDSNLYMKYGKSFSVRGTLRADAQTGELYIEATSALESAAARIFLNPVTMNGRAVLDKAAGVDIVGLDVKVVGRVTAVNSPSDFTINDGSGDLKVVVAPVSLNPWPAVGDFIDAEGIVSLDGGSPATAVRCIKLWNSNANMMDPIVAGFEKTNPLEGWGYDDNTGGRCSLTWDTTNPHSGINCAQLVNTAGFGPGVYGRLYTILGGQFLDAEYEVSFWVRGTGVVDTGQSCHLTDWGSFAINPPAGDYGWTKVGTKFRFLGSSSGVYPNNLFLNFNVVNFTSPIAVDDFHVRWARGSIHVLEPAPAPAQ